jgi:hypothetical protein
VGAAEAKEGNETEEIESGLVVIPGRLSALN